MRRMAPLPAFHVMAKPTGARCNLSCDYCFFLKKDQLYPGSNFRMSDEVLEAYIRQTIEAHRVPQVTIAWQGGEPTLMGLDFFRRAVDLEKKYARSGMRIENTLQTNGVLLDARWCRFLRENKFLVGLSVDGPRHLHDVYRHDKAGGTVFDRVVRAAKLMQKHRVEFNILCTVNSANSRHPLEVYRFFRDELKTPFLQFIPIVEVDASSGQVTNRSVLPEQYGRFLIEIFDEWVSRDVGKMFVLFFDGVLMSYLRGSSSLCVLRPRCGDGVALEHNGDVYSCDHFVEPAHLLGNIMEAPLADLVGSDKQQRFGQAKSDTLPQYCKQCRYLFTCHGECPKNRVSLTPSGEPGLNWLCPGLKAFYRHTERPMQIMAELLHRGRPAGDIMKILPRNQEVSTH
ncbi:anaerobic sulfatase maturase [Methanocella sp. MCL-LM]|uniref:anaerobic sulfatase maturase n=1 Tax=Methanocella sp. MCL-LM TaxID=3412035 RepID=UPI003C76AD03